MVSGRTKSDKEKSGELDYALYKRLGDVGVCVCGMVIPEEFGGTNADYLSHCLARSYVK